MQAAGYTFRWSMCRTSPSGLHLNGGDRTVFCVPGLSILAVELTLLGITTLGIADRGANLRAMNRVGKRLGCRLG
jgi:hypothetical protein